MKKTITFLKFCFLVVILFTGSEVAWGQASVSSILYNETFGDYGSSSTTFSASTMSAYDRRGTTTLITADKSSITFSGANAMYSTATGANMTSGHVWLNKSTTGNIQISGIPVYNASKIKVSFSQGGSGSIDVYANFGSGETKVGTSTAASVSFETAAFSTSGTALTLNIKRQSNSNNLRIDNITVTVTEITLTCTTPTFSFASSSLSKLTTDGKFTNTFTSNNTSTKVWSSSNTGVATVDAGTGEVTIVGAGTSSIKVNQAADATYCAVVDASYTLTVTAPTKPEPTNHATSFAATTNSTNQITVTWTDATGTQLPDGYLVIASTTTPTTPVDGTAQTDATLVKNITQGTQQAVFTGLSASTTYNFSIWPYTNSGAAIDYKTDGSVPTASATTETPLGVAVATTATDVTSTGFTANWGATAGATGYDVNVYTKTAGTTASDLFISEYIEAAPGNRKAIQIFNGTGADVTLTDVYTLKLGVNGASLGGTTNSTIALTGTVAAGGVFVIAYGTDGGYTTNQVSTYLSFNGDDAIGLFKNNELLDVFGTPGTDPGTGWAIGGTANATVDHIITRNASVMSPVTTWNIDEWTLGAAYTTAAGDAAAAATLTSHNFAGGSTNAHIPGSPFTVGNVTSKSVTGLTQGTDYYYTVVAKKGAESAVASNEVSVTTLIPTFTGTGDWTESARWNTASVPASTEDVIVDGDATISSNVEVAGLTINASKSLSVDASKQLTVSGTLTNNGTLNLLSTAAGTATLNTTAVSGTGTANVSQYLSSARNWYVSSPVTAAVAPSGYTYYQRDEAGASWVTQPFVTGNTFIRGKGYIALPGAAGSTLTFSGKLNVADTTVALTWSGASSKGFNLIGNPYPCHLTWTKAFTDANVSLIESSIYYRTNSGTVNNSGQWSNPTYNAFSGASVGGATGVIPPMQAVWVRAIAAGNLTLDNKLTRSHESSNPMKAPAVATSQNLRLVVSDGTSSDEMLVYFNANASNAYDAYDSPKMINGVSSVVPDMYTMVGNEELVINGMSTIPAEIPLYIKPNASTSGQFSLRATEVSNFEAGTQVYIKNGKTGEQQLVSDGSVYSFDITADPLLSIIIKAPGAVTGLDNPTSTFNVYANAKGQLTVVVPAVNDGDVARVYNSAGQCILNQSLTNSRTMLNKFFTAGVYVVKVNETIRKVVIE